MTERTAAIVGRSSRGVKQGRWKGQGRTATARIYRPGPASGEMPLDHPVRGGNHSRTRWTDQPESAERSSRMKRSHRASTSAILSLALVLSTIVCAQGSVRSAATPPTRWLPEARSATETSSTASKCSHPGCQDEGAETPPPSACCFTWAPAVSASTFAPPTRVPDPRFCDASLVTVGVTLSAAARSVRPAWSFPPGVVSPPQLILCSSLLGRAPPLA